jgi:hypothetical protein
MWIYTSTPPYTFMALCLVKPRDNFTFYPMQKMLRETHSQPEPYRQGKDLLLLPRIELNYDPSAIQTVV